MGPHQSRNTQLLIVSPDKPTGINKNWYLPLVSTKGCGDLDSLQSLNVTPPLHSDGKPLYVHTFPELDEYTDYSLRGTPVVPAFSLPGNLDRESLDVLHRTIREHVKERRQLYWIETASSGGSEPVEAKWDTWTGKEGTESGMLVPFRYYFEHIAPPPGFSYLNPTTIYQDFRLYRQLAEDFSWPGVTSCIKWARGARRHNEKHGPLKGLKGTMLEPATPRQVVTSHATQQLCAMTVPRDGDPPMTTESSKEKELAWWDDGPDTQFEQAPHTATKAISAVDIKIIVFDLLGTVLDREKAVRDSINRFVAHFQIAPSPSLSQVVTRYVEFEGLEYSEHAELDFKEIAKTSLQNVGDYFGLCVTNEEADTILEPLLKMRLPMYEDARSALEVLTAGGYTTFCFSSAVVTNQSLPPGLASIPSSVISYNPYSRIPADMSHLEDHLRSVYPGIKSQQILIISASQYRVTERANVAGFPTILVRRPGTLLASIDIDTAPPTLTAEDMLYVSNILRETSSINPSSDTRERKLGGITPLRIRELYQMDSFLGRGGYGNVWDALHLSTGEAVAIKVEIPTGEADEICLLPCEAQIYRHLAGYNGIPNLRWCGMDGGAHVMILDKLGPTLDQLRRFCRDKLSLRTVVTLAIDILDRIEFIHSTGIILRDVKPQNFAMGIDEYSDNLYLFDFGLAKLYADPTTGEHIPYREGRERLGTLRFMGYNVHLGREQSRRDDMEGVGNMLLFLLHGRLPWQGIYAPNADAKILRTGEMKRGQAFEEFLDKSPSEFKEYFRHCRSLAYEEKPDYDFLKGLFRKRLEEEGWLERKLDWILGADSENGTLMEGEYRFDPKFVDVEIDRYM